MRERRESYQLGNREVSANQAKRMMDANQHRILLVTTRERILGEQSSETRRIVGEVERSKIVSEGE